MGNASSSKSDGKDDFEFMDDGEEDRDKGRTCLGLGRDRVTRPKVPKCAVHYYHTVPAATIGHY